MTPTEFLLSIENHTTEQLREFNKVLVEEIRFRLANEARAKSRTINMGDIIRFEQPGRGRHAGIHYVKVDSFKKNRTAICGYSVTSKGEPLPNSIRWTVSLTACKVV